MYTSTLRLPWLRFSMLFPQLLRKCQGKTRKDWVRPALFEISCYFVLFCSYLCCSMLLFVSFYLLLLCICVLYYCYDVSTQLHLTNISYHIVSYHIIYHIIYRVITCYVTSLCHFTSRLARHFTPLHVTARYVMSCQFM